METTTTKKKLNLVMEGGGVKGIGLVGAIATLEEDCEWVYLAGTSAGAIVATLLAVGYTGRELETIMKDLDFSKVMNVDSVKKDFMKLVNAKGWWKLLKIGPIYRLYNRLKENYGLFDGDYIEKEVVDELIRVKTGKRCFTFGDLQEMSRLPAPKLSLMVTDISNRRLLILPRDAAKLGYNPQKLQLAKAMRMSMSFPFFFVPVKTKKGWVMDGGVLSNFPYWYLAQLDTNSLFADPIPTIGLMLDEKEDSGIRDFWGLGKALLNTMIAPLDQAYMDKDFDDLSFEQRVIKINVKGISTLDFSLGTKDKDRLYNNGVKAAKGFKPPQEDLFDWIKTDSWGASTYNDMEPETFPNPQ